MNGLTTIVYCRQVVIVKDQQSGFSRIKHVIDSLTDLTIKDYAMNDGAL